MIERKLYFCLVSLFLLKNCIFQDIKKSKYIKKSKCVFFLPCLWFIWKIAVEDAEKALSQEKVLSG